MICSSRRLPLEGFAFTKMPDTFGFDVTDFQPLLNRIMEEYNKLKPDAVLIYVNPIAAPALYKGLRTLGVTTPIQGSPAASLTRRSSPWARKPLKVSLSSIPEGS